MSTRAQLPAVQKPSSMLAPVPAGTLSRKCACGGAGNKRSAKSPNVYPWRMQRRAVGAGGPEAGGVVGGTQPDRSWTDNPWRVQNDPAVIGTPDVAPAIVGEVLSSSGQPLDTDASASMGSYFGHDFSDVRIHTDELASKSARAMGAEAYTVGQDVVFAAGKYAPWTTAGRRLLAHELTHVVQQGDRSVSSGVPLRVSDPADASEQQAERVADDYIGASRSAAEPSATPDKQGPSCTDCTDARASLRALDTLLKNDKVDAQKFGALLGGMAVAVDGRWLAENLGTGAPLDRRVRSDMEQQFGQDLSHVRIHTGKGANRIARTLNARAVTVGQHIALANGEFDVSGQQGRNLLIHELAHTLQQPNIGGIPSGHIAISRTNHRSEREADRVVEAASNGDRSQLNRYLSTVSSPMVNLSVCGIMVEGACWAFFSAIAAAIAVGCAAGTVVTVGGLAIPCTAIIIGSAGLAAWDAVMCTNILKQEICGEPIQ